MLLRALCLLWAVSSLGSAAVFLERGDAHGVLQRSRRANTGFLEELKPGNLERECIEEICDYEEAREVFEDDDNTKQFWLTYNRRDPCLVNPCRNNGTCIYMESSYICQCPEGYEGRYCQTVFEDSLKCLYQNGGCQHFCDGSGPRRTCTCTEGYELGEDGRQCVAQVQYPCGLVPPEDPEVNHTVQGQTRLVGGNHCPKGECPWQVLVQYRGNSHCGGVLVRPDWVITAAHCIHGNDLSDLTVVAGEHDLDVEEGTEQRMPISMAIPHERYAPATGDSDIALLCLGRPVALGRYAVPVCLPQRDFLERELTPVRYHSISGWGRRTSGGNQEKPDASQGPTSPVLRRLSVPLLSNAHCSQRSGFNFTDSMLCAGYLEGHQDACTGDDGSPLVTLYGSTHFLMGVVGWGRGCPHPGYYGVYTNMAHFLDWVEGTMKAPPNVTVANERQVEKASPVVMEQKPVVIFLDVHSVASFPSGESCHGSVGLVFLDGESASQVLTRRRRANSPFEEFRQGNMERECIEERCDREEAREIFEDEDKTNEFWNKYVDGDACESSPCAHDGLCKDAIGTYTCFCPAGYQGYNCEIVIPELCETGNGGCEHFCEVHQEKVHCSCADGYNLGSDDKACYSNETYKCGAIFNKNTRSVFRYERPNVTESNSTDLHPNMTQQTNTLDNLPEFRVPQSNVDWHLDEDYSEDVVVEDPVIPNVVGNTRIVNGEECPPGECPWQALLLNDEHRGFCGGTILNKYFILTAAHCMNQSRYIYVILGEFDTEVKEGREAIYYVETVLIHKHYKPETYHNDIALIKLSSPVTFSQFILPACLPQRDFAEKVLMRQPDGLVSGFGRIGEGRQPSTVLQRLTMPYVDRSICLESSSFRVSNRMFCAGYDNIKKDACQGDSGGPHVTRYRETYFVTGVVSWGEGCARDGKYGFYTQVSKYINWIRDGMEKLVPRSRLAYGASRSRSRRHTAPFKTLWL
ncbi:uncharacterized protein ACJ7VT_019731 [Polymixia lowei]